MMKGPAPHVELAAKLWDREILRSIKMTRQEMIDEAVRRVMQPGRFIETSLWSMGPWMRLEQARAEIMAPSIRAEFRRIEAARSAVREVGEK